MLKLLQKLESENHNIKKIINIIFLMLSLLMLTNISQAAENLIIVHNANSKIHQETISGLKENFNNPNNIIPYSIEKYKTTNPEKHKNDIIIAIGKYATETALQNATEQTIYSILIPSSTFKALQQRYSANNNLINAIYIDQPIKRRIKIIKEILPKAKTLGLVTSEENFRNYGGIISELKKFGYSVNNAHFRKYDNTIAGFREVAKKSDAIFAIADSIIYNRKTIKNILLTSYREKTPIIGYSSALTKAGALFSIYTPPYFAGKELAEILNQHNTASLPTSKHPKYYRLIVNRHVAHSLNITLPNSTDSTEVRQD